MKITSALHRHLHHEHINLPPDLSHTRMHAHARTLTPHSKEKNRGKEDHSILALMVTQPGRIWPTETAFAYSPLRTHCLPLSHVPCY